MLDYIYSDSINVLMGLNRRILDVSGRLSLLAPQPEAIQVLKRAGIHNILRIFETEADLLKTSEDIILQTSSFKISELQALANENLPPQSEFDQLRTEIGSVFGSNDDSEQNQSKVDARQYETQQVPLQHPYTTQPIPAAEINASINEEFDNAFNQLEGFDQTEQQGFLSAKKQQVPPPQQYIPQTPPPASRANLFRPGAPSTPVQPQFQGRQYVPPSPASQSRFESTPKIPSRGFVPSEPPKVMPDFSVSRTETQRFQSTAGIIRPTSLKAEAIPEVGDSLESFEPSSTKSTKSKTIEISDSYDTDEEFSEGKKKKSPLPILIVIVLIIAIGGGIAYFGLSGLNSKPKISNKDLAAPPAKPIEQVAPQVPVDTPASIVENTSEPAKSEEKAEISTTTGVTEIVAPVENEPVKPKTVYKRPVIKTKSKSSTSSEIATGSLPDKSASVNKVVIASVPSGASVEINGKILGNTPLTWDKPVYGLVNVIVRKSGYEEKERSFEFSGGTVSESITLNKISVPPPAPVAAKEITPEPVAPAPRTVIPPPAPSISEPEPVIPPPVTKPSVVTSGGDASIFIASIPPVADVYLNGNLIGKTNVSEIKLPSGTHTLKFVKGAKEVSKEVTVQAGKNPSQMVRLP